MRTLPDVVLKPLINQALLEDLGRAGDITTDTIIPADQISKVALVARHDGVLAGFACARLAWQMLDPNIEVAQNIADGALLKPGDVIGSAKGSTRALLSGERVGLNLLGHLSGVATQTRMLVDAVSGTKANIVDTRKTTPGLRVLEKYAVRCGGGMNHRFGLDDAVLIKDNHIAAAGSVAAAVSRARQNIGHMVKLEVEVDTLDQLDQLLKVNQTLKVDAVLLDNMAPEVLRQAVEMVDGAMLTEASGRITIATVAAVAASGVDMISAGWITHSAPVLDIGLDYIG